MSKRRLQVFISSTFLDLQEERRAAVMAILNAKHIPEGMELFAAENRAQFDVICQHIDHCDTYILLVGTRYGSIEPNSQKSYTELEYDYADSKGIPCAAMVLDENWRNEKAEALKTKAFDDSVKADTFRKRLLTNKLCSVVKNQDHLTTEILKALRHCEEHPDLVGWMRRDSEEHLSLRAQVTTLQQKLIAVEAQVREQVADLQQKLVRAEAQLREQEVADKISWVLQNVGFAPEVIAQTNQAAKESRKESQRLERELAATCERLLAAELRCSELEDHLSKRENAEASPSQFVVVEEAYQTRTVDELFFNAVRAFCEGKYFEAIEFNDAVLKVDPRHAAAFAGRSNVKLMLEDHQGAFEDAQQAILLNPQLRDAYYSRAVARVRLGDVSGSIQDFSKCIEIDPNFAFAFNNRGWAFQKTGEYERARADYLRAMELDNQYLSPKANLTKLDQVGN